MPARHLTDRQTFVDRPRGWSRTVEHGWVVWRAWRQEPQLAWELPVSMVQIHFGGRQAAASELRAVRENVRAEMALQAVVAKMPRAAAAACSG